MALEPSTVKFEKTILTLRTTRDVYTMQCEHKNLRVASESEAHSDRMWISPLH